MLSREQVCYIGDDLLDLATIRAVGLGVAVADAVEDVRHAAKYITSVPGGQAPVREVIELILRTRAAGTMTLSPIRSFAPKLEVKGQSVAFLRRPRCDLRCLASTAGIRGLCHRT